MALVIMLDSDLAPGNLHFNTLLFQQGTFSFSIGQQQRHNPICQSGF